MSKIDQLKTLGEAVARSPKTRKWGIRAAISIAVIGVLGFLVAPPVVKHVLLKEASEALHRPVTIETVRINPYTLSVTLEGLRVLDREGGELVAGFDSLYVNADLASIFRMAPVVTALRLEKPRLHVVRLAANRYNVSDLIDAFLAKPDGPTPRFSLSNIEVIGGEIEFEDHVFKEKHVANEVNLRLPFISSLSYYAEVKVEPAFSAKLDGSPLVLKGHTRPFDESLESEFVLDLDHLDLAKYNDYLPAQLPVQLAAGTLDGDLHLVFRQHASKPAVIAASGSLLFKGLDLRSRTDKPLATLKRFELDIASADLLHRQVSIKQLALEELAAQGANVKEALHITSASIHDLKLDLAKSEVVIAHAEGKQVQAQVARLANGGISWLVPLAGAGSSAAVTEPKPVPWQVSLAKLTLSDSQVRFEDQKTQPTAIQTVVLDTLDIEGLSSQPGQTSKLQLRAHVNQKGELLAQGSFQLAPMQADLALEASGIELLPLQPYFNDKISITVTRGQFAAKGVVKLQAAKDGSFQGAYQGNLTIGEFASVDQANSVDFLRWKSFFFGAIDAQSSPKSLSVGEVALTDFYSRLVVSPAGKLNLMQLFRSPGAVDAPTPAPTTGGEPAVVETVVPVIATPVAAAGSPPVPIQVGKVTLQGGTVNFTDNYIKPHYSARLTKIGGRITGLSSAASSVADLELRGSYDNLAPITIAGKINPLAAKPFLDIKAEVRAMDMTPFSPYSGKYAGYAIEKGKLSLFVNYKLENQQLTAENRIFLDQLTFGEPMESPEATKLPVRLAVALLQNRNGEIDINLPISGSLDDPQFSLGGIIGRVILNLFVKVVTSPFSLLGSIFGGGGAELSSMEFEPGYASINSAGKTKLDNMAKVLLERPALKLEVEGNVDLERDREGYKSAVLDRKVRRQKLNDLVKKGVEAEMSGIEIDPKEYPDLLDKVYRAENFPKPRNLIGLVKSLPVDEMEKLIIANTQVSEDDLRELANRRAQRVRDWLVNQLKVPAERVFLVPPKFEKAGAKDGGTKASGVAFSLR